MATWFKSAKSSSSEPDDNDGNEKENLTIAWIYKPPYIKDPITVPLTIKLME